MTKAPDPDESVFADAAAEINERREDSRLPNWWFAFQEFLQLCVLSPFVGVLAGYWWLKQKLP